MAVMSRPAPKFAVGEGVILLNESGVKGEGIIVDRFWINNRSVKERTTPYSGWCYEVSGFHSSGYGCVEYVLRKKPRPDHIPADQSFDQIMQGLKRPQGVEV